MGSGVRIVGDRTLPWFALVGWAVGCGWILILDDPKLSYPEYLAGWTVCAASWVGAVLLARRGRLRAEHVWIAVGLAIAARLVCLFDAPAFSEDVFRHVYEGRVVWWGGPGFPFVHAPSEAPALGVPPHMLDQFWSRINHSEISTVYPPFSQLVFVAAGGIGELVGGGHLVLLKLLLIAADLGTWALIARALAARGRKPGEGLAWGLCPLVVFEVARDGHADSLSAFGMTLGIIGFATLRPRIGYAGWAVAALAKLNGLVALPVALRSTRRGAWVGVGVCSLLLLPWLFAGLGAVTGLTEYATRWRAGDGVFSVLLEISEWLLGGDWKRVGEFVITRHQLARVMVGLVFVFCTFILLRLNTPLERVPERVGLLLLAALLLSPTLHPWFVIWLVPFVALQPTARGGRAMLALTFLSALLHHPAWLERTEGQWTDLWWIRALVHLPVWGLLAWDLVGRTSFSYAPSNRPPDDGGAH